MLVVMLVLLVEVIVLVVLVVNGVNNGVVIVSGGIVGVNSENISRVGGRFRFIWWCWNCCWFK